MTKLAGTAGSLAVIAVGAVLTLAVRSSSLPGAVVMLIGLVGLAAMLIRSVGGPGRRERPHRATIAPEHDPDRAYFAALREAPPTATTRNPAGARLSGDDHESQGSYTPGIYPRPGAGQR